MKMFLISMLVVFAATAEEKVYQSEGQKFAFEVLVEKDGPVWGLDFLPDRQVIFTTRPGKMYVHDLKTKKTAEVSGVPKVYAEGQGGLLDVRVHPDFAKNSLVYFTYSKAVGDDKSTTVLARGSLKAGKLSEVKELFSALEPNSNDHHYGSRVEFDGKGHIILTIGDRGKRDLAQDLSVHNGKVLRLNEDGTVPKDNPFGDKKNARPEIWTMGHRSPQGLALHPVTGELWLIEMGPRGGDEVNVLSAGKNYGWPVTTHGREYHGPKIGKVEKEGMVQPTIHWVPSISPSGGNFYNGDKFPKWKGDLFLACLSGEEVRRVSLKGNKVVKQESLLEDLEERFRHVRQGKDGHLYLSTDDGKLGRLVPR